MPSVAFASTDWSPLGKQFVPNGCTWYRCILPSRILKAMGWEAKVGRPGVDENHGWGVQVESGMYVGFDVTVLKLMMHKVALAVTAEMQRMGRRIGVDVDDFHQGLHVENHASRATDPRLHPESNRGWYEQLIRQADFVTVSTEFLAEHYSRRCREVHLVRNGVDWHRFPQRDVTKPVLGWVGATPWRSGDLEMLASWLPQFVKDTGVGVHHSGAIPHDPRSFSHRAGVALTSSAPMQLIGSYPKMLDGFSIGLVPLNPIPFNEAKSYIKGLEYAASGIPFVASDTYEYRILAEAGVARIARTPDEWRDHVTELLDVDVRVAEGQRIREIVKEQFSIERQGEAWATAIRG